MESSGTMCPFNVGSTDISLTENKTLDQSSAQTNFNVKEQHFRCSHRMDSSSRLSDGDLHGSDRFFTGASASSTGASGTISGSCNRLSRDFSQHFDFSFILLFWYLCGNLFNHCFCDNLDHGFRNGLHHGFCNGLHHGFRNGLLYSGFSSNRLTDKVFYQWFFSSFSNGDRFFLCQGLCLHFIQLLWLQLNDRFSLLFYRSLNFSRLLCWGLNNWSFFNNWGWGFNLNFCWSFFHHRLWFWFWHGLRLSYFNGLWLRLHNGLRLRLHNCNGLRLCNGFWFWLHHCNGLWFRLHHCNGLRLHHCNGLRLFHNGFYYGGFHNRDCNWNNLWDLHWSSSQFSNWCFSHLLWDGCRGAPTAIPGVPLAGGLAACCSSRILLWACCKSESTNMWD
ncbi:hypothetical protein F7725_013500 [Dissostichus mawsoni]|uniref:Uncharacterized protein n=1 Tax=Dissostichus mawsoni TaxID=36200 RepID=A0A7J5YU95_DISMA|nr:hypothetical protein F7725_013500 [Dissostichus mawsoni]